MILVDTGPFVALFDPKDSLHNQCKATLRSIREPLFYSDHPMDLADASLIVAAEALQTRKIFTLDRGDFSTYRIRRGHQHEAVEIIG